MKFSIVLYSHVLENADFRIDAEYHHPEFIRNDKLLISKENLNFADKGISIQFGHTPKGADFFDAGIPFIRSKNCNNNFVDEEDVVYISEEEHAKQLRSCIMKNDILIAAVGATIGQIGFSVINGANINQNIARVRVKSSMFTPEFLFVFLKGKFGQYQLGKLNTGNARDYLNSFNISALKFPALGMEIQNLSKSLVCKSYYHMRNFKKIYKKGESSLLMALDIQYDNLINSYIFEKDFLSVKKAERFDASYFQPKYEEVKGSLRKYKNGFDSLKNLLTIKDKNFEPEQDKEYRYIEISDIASDGSISSCSKGTGKELPTRARRKVSQGDVVISSIEGSLESVALISEEWDGALCSNGFFIVNSNSINSETLFMFMKSKAAQMQLKQNCRGAILAALRKEDFTKILIPKFDTDFQAMMKEKVSKMYEAQNTSRRLIETATRGVEIAIEENEKAAEKWIHSELDKLNITI